MKTSKNPQKSSTFKTTFPTLRDQFHLQLQENQDIVCHTCLLPLHNSPCLFWGEGIECIPCSAKVPPEQQKYLICDFGQREKSQRELTMGQHLRAIQVMQRHGIDNQAMSWNAGTKTAEKILTQIFNMKHSKVMKTDQTEILLSSDSAHHQQRCLPTNKMTFCPFSQQDYSPVDYLLASVGSHSSGQRIRFLADLKLKESQRAAKIQDNLSMLMQINCQEHVDSEKPLEKTNQLLPYQKFLQRFNEEKNTLEQSFWRLSTKQISTPPSIQNQQIHLDLKEQKGSIQVALKKKSAKIKTKMTTKRIKKQKIKSKEIIKQEITKVFLQEAKMSKRQKPPKNYYLMLSKGIKIGK